MAGSIESEYDWNYSEISQSSELAEDEDIELASADAWKSCVVYKNISHANGGLDYANILLC